MNFINIFITRVLPTNMKILKILNILNIINLIFIQRLKKTLTLTGHITKERKNVN